MLRLADLYRRQADAENVADELRNKWARGGFITKDKLRCQVVARNAALIDNWRCLSVQYTEPKLPRGAVTSLPLLLCAVGRRMGSVTLRRTNTHAHAAHIKRLLTNLRLFLSGLKNTAEQSRPSHQ